MHAKGNWAKNKDWYTFDIQFDPVAWNYGCVFTETLTKKLIGSYVTPQPIPIPQFLAMQTLMYDWHMTR